MDVVGPQARGRRVGRVRRAEAQVDPELLVQLAGEEAEAVYLATFAKCSVGVRLVSPLIWDEKALTCSVA